MNDEFNEIEVNINNDKISYEEFEYDDRNNVLKKSLGTYEFVLNEGNNYAYNEYQ